MYDLLLQPNIAFLAKAVLEGACQDHSLNLSSSLKFVVNGIVGSGGKDDVSQLPTDERVMRAFKILHDEKSRNPILTDDQFRFVRRAVGNGNYEKVFALLGVYWRAAESDAKSQIEQAAAIFGSLKKANKYYRSFSKTLS